MAGCAAKICGSKSLVTTSCHSATGRRRRSASGARRDPLVRLYDHEGQPPKAERKGRHDLAPSGAELRGVAHEERRIAAQLGGAGDQLRFGQMQVEKPVESQQNRRAVGRTATQPGAERHPLVEPDSDAVHAVTVAHGKHHRFEVVITVRTAAQDIQPQIYFAVCP